MNFWSERSHRVLPKGVYMYRRGDNYTAAICMDHKQRHLGVFPTVEAASAAYQEAKMRREEGTFEEHYPQAQVCYRLFYNKMIFMTRKPF